MANIWNTPYNINMKELFNRILSRFDPFWSVTTNFELLSNINNLGYLQNRGPQNHQKSS